MRVSLIVLVLLTGECLAEKAPKMRDILGGIGDGTKWFDELEQGKTYSIENRKPKGVIRLMPFYDPDAQGHSRTMGAISDAMTGKLPSLPSKSVVTVFEVAYRKSDSVARPWYRVKGFDTNGKLVGEGWINSIALMGQKLKDIGPSDVVIREIVPKMETPQNQSKSTEIRTWTDSTGKFNVQAAFAGYGGGVVKLKRAANGEILKVPMDKLSVPDQEFIRALARK